MTAVQILRELVLRAERGEIEAVALAILYREGVSASAYSDCDDFVRLVGAASILQHELIVVASSPDMEETPPDTDFGLGRAH